MGLPVKQASKARQCASFTTAHASQDLGVSAAIAVFGLAAFLFSSYGWLEHVTLYRVKEDRASIVRILNKYNTPFEVVPKTEELFLVTG